MTIPMWSLLAGIFLPYILAFASLPFRLKQFGEVDFRYPRRQAENSLMQEVAWSAPSLMPGKR